MKMNKSDICGQALVESLFSFTIVFLVLFACIEVFRLLAFQSVLQSSAFYAAQITALHELDFQDKNSKNYIKNFQSINQENLTTSNNFVKNLQKNSQNDLLMVGSSLFSYDRRSKNTGMLSISKEEITPIIKIVPPGHTYFSHGTLLPAGVYVSFHACLPELFAAYLKWGNENTNQLSDVSKDSDQNCLGQFNQDSSSGYMPQWWFSVRAAAYSPWTASAQIYEHGLGVPSDPPAGMSSLIYSNFIKNFNNQQQDLQQWLP